MHETLIILSAIYMSFMAAVFAYEIGKDSLSRGLVATILIISLCVIVYTTYMAMQGAA